MKNARYMIFVGASVILSSCAEIDNHQGALAGGILGSGAGAIIGHQSGNAGAGALIGGAAGALLGEGIQQSTTNQNISSARPGSTSTTRPGSNKITSSRQRSASAEPSQTKATKSAPPSPPQSKSFDSSDDGVIGY